MKVHGFEVEVIGYSRPLVPLTLFYAEPFFSLLLPFSSPLLYTVVDLTVKR